MPNTRARIFVVHPYRLSMPPMDAAFREGWPEAELVRILDDSLYADVTPDGTMAPSIPARLESLFRHCVLSGAKGIVFTGSTFGPAVETARRSVDVPVLKADEAMTEAAVARGGRILIVGTAKRAIPVLRRSVESVAAAASKKVEVGEAWVAGAQEANNRGDAAEHDALIADAIAGAEGWDVVLLGQMSMAPALALVPDDALARVLTSPAASVAKMRRLLAG